MLKILGSYRLAFALLASALAASILVAVLHITGRDIAGFSPYVVLLIGISASILSSIYARIRREIIRVRNNRNMMKNHGNRYTCMTTLPSDIVLKVAQRIIHLDKWNIRSTSNGFHALKESGTVGIWGSILFHLSIVLIIVGIIIKITFGFEGMFALTEGESIVTDADVMRLSSWGPLFDPDRLWDYKVKLERYERELDVNGTGITTAHVRVMSGTDTLNAPLRMNSGLGFGGFKLNKGRLWGYSPGLVITDSTGSEIIKGFVRIATQDDSGILRYKDRINVGENEEVHLELFPDFRSKDGEYSTVSRELRNPVLSVKLLADGDVKLDEIVALNNAVNSGGYFVGFHGVRRWSQFEIVHDPGLWVIFAGFLFALIGLTVRLFFVRRRMVLSACEGELGTKVILSGSSEKFQHTFRALLEAEYNRLSRTLKEEELKSFLGDGKREIEMVEEQCS